MKNWIIIFKIVCFVNILNAKVLYQSDKYVSFPDAKIINNFIYLVFREALNHHSKDGKIKLCIFNPEKMNLLSCEFIVNSSFDERDPSLFVEEDHFYLSYFYFKKYVEKEIKTKVIKFNFDLKKIYEIESDYQHSLATSSPGFKIQNKVFFPLYGRSSQWNFSKIYFLDLFSNIIEVFSGEKDQIWTQEPFVLNLNEKDYVIFTRNAKNTDSIGGLDYLRFYYFKNNELFIEKQIKILGQAPYALLNKNNILLTYRNLNEMNEKKCKVSLSILSIESLDKGLVENDQTLYQSIGDEKNFWDCGYPSLFEYKNKIYIVFYTLNGHSIDIEEIIF